MGDLRSPDIVFSHAGHDRGRAYIVLKTDDDRLCVVDGKVRKLLNPKIKSPKHLKLGKQGNPELAEAICNGTATDKLIRKELAVFRSEVGMTEEGNQFVKR